MTYERVFRSCWTIVTAWAVLCGWAVAGPVRLAPTPRHVTWSEQAPLELEAKSIVIVMGQSASDPELYAAQQLQKWVQKRFGVQWPIVPEQDRGRPDVEILLGQRRTHRRLDALCKRHKIELSAARPGFDGYVIEMFEDDGRPVVLVGGCNARGVVYGQDTLFQLIGRKDGKLVLHRASIQDAPAVPWRGRPQTSVSHYFRPDELDIYMTARMNFIDLREGIYAFDPGAELDKPLLSRAVREAHRRGLVVYGVVNCGVSSSQYEAVLRTFKELLDLGADGLWLSFDDKGPGSAPEQLVYRVLQLGQQRGITGSRIVITPPKGSYQVIANAANGWFNRKIMGVPGMERAMWLWTCVPTPAALEEGRSIGLKVRPGWWHNWPRLKAPHSYIEVPPMAWGWNGPTYEMLAACQNSAEAVMPWGGNAWGQYYVAPIIGWWGWNPKGHDWDATRSRIYDIVYGPGQAADMRAFDDALAELKSKLHYSMGSDAWHPYCPARLKRLEDRPQAVALTERMEALLTRVERRAAEQSMLGRSELDDFYLAPARKELNALKAMVTLDYPEYWWVDHQRRVLTAVYDGREADADRLMAEVRDRLLEEVRQVEQKLGPYRKVGAYVQWWRRCAARKGADWRRVVRERRRELTDRVWEYGYFFAKTSTMLADADNPPLNWGTGRWEWTNTVQATVLPTEREMFWGTWLAGVCEYKGRKYAAFASDRKANPASGEFAELEVRIPVSGERDRLALMFFASSVSDDLIGGDHVPYRWGGHRFMELRWGDKLLWEMDLGPKRIEGEWFVVPLPEIPADVKELSLQLRVVDRRAAVSNQTIAFVSPIRLVEMPVFGP